MAEITINGNLYRTGKLSVMDQFFVTKRLLPVLSGAGSLQGVVAALATVSDEDCTFVIGKCLSLCLREQHGSWTSIWNARINQLQFDDIDMGQMINLTTTTLQENLGPFMPALPSISNQESSRPNGQLNS